MFRISRWRGKEKAKHSQHVGSDAVDDNEWTAARSTYHIALLQVVYVCQSPFIVFVQRPRNANMRSLATLGAILITVFLSKRF